jgi:hypothetical protein
MPGIPIRVDSLDYMLQKIQILGSLETICNYQYSQTCLQRPWDPQKVSVVQRWSLCRGVSMKIAIGLLFNLDWPGLAWPSLTGGRC